MRGKANTILQKVERSLPQKGYIQEKKCIFDFGRSIPPGGDKRGAGILYMAFSFLFF